MAMASAEQPLKKRKLLEPLPDLPEPPPQPPPTPPPPPPPPPPAQAPPPSFVAPPPPSQEEILRKRRNRDEIRSLYDCYKRIRACVAHKDARLMPELEQAYLSLITASRGCTSVQRIVADLIPKYASYCPTALEAAAKVVINMHNWSLALITRGEDTDNVAFQTAKTCILGLVDICCSASAEAPTSSVIKGICAAVFSNVLSFFLSSFEGKSIFQIVDIEIINIQYSTDVFSDLKQKFSDNNEPALVKLSKFRALSLLKIFFSCPKNSIAACFELFNSTSTEGVNREGRWILSLLTCTLATDDVAPLDNTSNGPKLCSNSSQMSSNSNKVASDITSNGDDTSAEASPYLKNCLLGLVLRKDSSLRRWICSKFKKLSKSAAPQKVSEISSALEGIMKSFRELINATDSQSDSDEDSSVATKLIGRQYMVPKVSSQHETSYEISCKKDYPARVNNGSCNDVPADLISSKHLRSHGSSVSLETDLRSNLGSEQSSVGSRSMDFEVGGQVDSSRGRSSMPKDLVNNLSPSPVARKPLEFRADSFGSRTNLIHVDDNHQRASIGLSMPPLSSVSGGASHALMSPNHCPTVPNPSAISQTAWCFDGDPTAMDIYSASRQLWLGSLGPHASESHVRFQFERFGPIEQFQFFPMKGFALVVYRNIIDAVKARECMRGRSPWGACLHIKFMDIGLGTRGAINGMAVGSSSHVYVGSVHSAWARDELMHEIMKVIRKVPCMVTDLNSESALLIEFETPEEAVTVMTHLRRHRQETSNCHLPHGAGFANTRGSHVDITRPVPAPICIDAGSTNHANMPAGVFESSHAQRLKADHVESGPASQSNWTASGYRETCEVGMRKIDTYDNTVMNSSQGGGHVASSSAEQMWMYKKPEVEHHPATGSIPCMPPPIQGSSVVPVPQILTTSFTHPVYHPPNNSWDGRGYNYHLPPTPNLPGMVPNNFQNNAVAVPYLPPSVTPLAQIQGSSHFDQTFPLPVAPPPLSCLPPQPAMAPPLPPSPPPLPPSQPPTVPPPPSSPPPQPISNLVNPKQYPQYQWLGTLCKSGIPYCTIYAQRVDSDICKYSNAISEPSEWPAKLDMTKRTDFRHVMSTFSSTPPHRREVCLLLPSSSGDHKGFQDFVTYLRQRECVGVIKIPAIKSIWARLLFILPHSLDACSMLSISSKPSDCLIALVLPKDANELV